MADVNQGNLLVSIITVCYNSEQTIRDTIESVLNQDYDRIEYLIIDGESKDGTVSIANSYQERFRERGYIYRIVSEKDAGLYDAMNKGIRQAGGALIGIINSDDWYEPEAVRTAVEAYREEAYDMFYADIRLIRQDGKSMIKHSRHDRFPTSRHWNHPTTFITKQTYEELGGYLGEGIHDDFELFLRIRRAGKRIVIRNVVLANFRSGGVSNNKSFANCRRRCRDRYRCYRNNGYGRWYLMECVAIETAKYLMG